MSESVSFHLTNETLPAYYDVNINDDTYESSSFCLRVVLLNQQKIRRRYGHSVTVLLAHNICTDAMMYFIDVQ